MPTFVHISDIHFGQERENGEVVVNDDIKKRLVEDAERELHRRGKHPAEGILVTGDIAYAGKTEQYKKAGEWLDSLALAIGCSKTSVHIVPGNHDIDRSEVSHGEELMLGQIYAKGEAQLEAYLSNKNDCQILYKKFGSYIPFAEAYNCPLDAEGGLAGNKPLTLADGRVLRFIGLNTALTCAKKDEEGKLVVGKKQRVLPMAKGEELVVLAHHPMNWLQDGNDALIYIRTRARVLITGHEHNPSVGHDTANPGKHLLVLAAGATVPPSNEVLHYTYNVIDFELDALTDDLLVTVYPRSWVNAEKDFAEDPGPLNGEGPTFRLECPFFKPGDVSHGRVELKLPSSDGFPRPEESVVHRPSQVETVSDDLALTLLRFFRDISPAERVRVLVRLEALPDDWTEELTHGLERQVIDELEASGRLSEVAAAIDWVQANSSESAEGIQ